MTVRHSCGIPLTAILREKSHQFRHAFEVDGVIDEPAALAVRTPGRPALSSFKWKENVARGNLQATRRCAPAATPFGSCLDQQTENRETRFLGERGEGDYGGI